MSTRSLLVSIFLTVNIILDYLYYRLYTYPIRSLWFLSMDWVYPILCSFRKIYFFHELYSELFVHRLTSIPSLSTDFRRSFCLTYRQTLLIILQDTRVCTLRSVTHLPDILIYLFKPPKRTVLFPKF